MIILKLLKKMGNKELKNEVKPIITMKEEFYFKITDKLKLLSQSQATQITHLNLHITV